MPLVHYNNQKPEQKNALKRYAIPKIVTETQIAANDMFEESHSLSLDKLVDHIAQDGADSIEPFVGMTDIG